MTILFSVINVNAGEVNSIVTYTVGMKSDRVLSVKS